MQFYCRLVGDYCRVKYREEVFVKKEEDKVQKKVDKANELAEKERRLEALRETVSALLFICHHTDTRYPCLVVRFI